MPPELPTGTALEAKSGYPHYVLAVGHLHEAEEESRAAWPDLAGSIRAARKDLQTTGTVPEWEGIMGMMERIAAGNLD